MLRPEDILAARFLFARLPQIREALIEHVDTLKALSDRPGLLPTLQEAEVITPPQASYLHAAVEAYKRERGMRIYGQRLVESGVPVERLQAVVNRLQAGGSMAVLGASLTEAGLIPLETEERLRAAAQEVLEAQLLELVVEFEANASRPEARRVRSATTRKFLSQAVGLGGAVDSALVEESSEGAGRALGDAEANAETRRLDPPAPPDQVQAPVEGLRLPSATGKLLRTRLEEKLGDVSEFEVPSWVDTSDPRRGERVKGYEILARIGVGAMGIVYLAREEGRPERPVALKVLPPEADDDAKGRFKREILANSFFSHPGALDIYDAGESASGEHYLAMEFFDGRDVALLLAEETRLEPALALRIAIQTLEPLLAAHEAALVHRDLKPDNILLSHDRSTARLMDFGLALIGDLGNFQSKVFETRKFGITGTPHYLSPEQAADDELTPSSDLYSLGVVLYQMLAGRLPFKAKSPKGWVMAHMTKPPLPLLEANPELSALPARLPELIDGLLQKEPEDRPSGAELAAGLAQVLGAIS
ncbi:MAG: protein kinase [Planctomycetes bacterium]|nr:protein kinase [Planctomycetota bacterium]